MKSKLLFILVILSIGFVVAQEFVTKEQAKDAILESKDIVERMKDNNFPTVYVEDLIRDAERTLIQAGYAEILRNDSAHFSLKAKASLELKLVDWRDITYQDVIDIAEEIKSREEQAFILYDSIIASKNTISNYEDLQDYNVDILLSPESPVEDQEILELFRDINNSFYEDRFEESESLIVELRDLIELKTAENTRFNTLRNGAKNFFVRYWYVVVLISLFAVIFGSFYYRKLSFKLLDRKIKKMDVEQNVLKDLMKKTQILRFKDNSISGLVYNARMNHYKKRSSEIKETLPVLESRLIDMKQNKSGFKNLFGFIKNRS